MSDHPNTAPAKGRAKKRALAALISMLLILVVGEVVIRVALPPRWFLNRKTDCYWTMRLVGRTEKKTGRIENAAMDAELGWTMRPGYVDEEQNESVNGLGYRGREVPHERCEGLSRIVVLGDSFTYGLGVGDDETYSARLEAKIDDSEVLNLGVNGFGTDQQLLYWKRDGVQFAPDTVLIGVYVPDFHRNGLSVRELPKPRFFVEGDELVASPTPLRTPREILAEDTDGCGSGSRVLDAVLYLLRRADGREPDGPFDEKARLMHGILELLRDSTSGAGAKLGVLVIPDQLYRGYQDHQRIERVIEGAASDLGIPVLNLTDPLIARQEETPGEPLYDAAHGHWTPLGHDVAADMILEFARRENLLSP